jgi:hypothetical protein
LAADIGFWPFTRFRDAWRGRIFNIALPSFVRNIYVDQNSIDTFYLCAIEVSVSAMCAIKHCPTSHDQARAGFGGHACSKAITDEAETLTVRRARRQARVPSSTMRRIVGCDTFQRAATSGMVRNSGIGRDQHIALPEGLIYAPAGNIEVAGVNLDSDERYAEFCARDARGAGPHKWITYRFSRVGAPFRKPVEMHLSAAHRMAIWRAPAGLH